MSYRKMFDPTPVEIFPTVSQDAAPAKVGDNRVRSPYIYGRDTKDMPGWIGDQREGSVYVYKDADDVVLAVNVALATGRPLLLRGPSGSGKSSLARNVARCLGWRYYEEVISSRTQARDLLWQFDTLRRLSDAQGNRVNPNLAAYIDPGVLWWAFDHESACWRGQSAGNHDIPQATERGDQPEHERAVVLLDEIDKADPDVPNNLLVAVGSLQFVVQETSVLVKTTPERRPLLIITTNDERELPAAFLRRCVIYELEAPNARRMVEIAQAHFGPMHMPLYEAIARHITEIGQADKSSRQKPSTAEYLDAVRACLEMEVTIESEVWQKIAKATLSKSRRSLEITR